MYRAIRARTVDLLGKTDQSYYYRNDLNCSKNPTCIFLALGSFMNWWIDQLVCHSFLSRKIIRWLRVLQVILFFFFRKQSQSDSKGSFPRRRSASFRHRLNPNRVSIALKVKYETPYTSKFIERQRIYFEVPVLYSLCLALNEPEIYHIN